MPGTGGGHGERGAGERGADPAAERLQPLLAELVDFERSRPSRREWDLSAIRKLLERPGAAPPPRPAIQVAGSKGKGTTCAFLAALARAAGLSVGVYTSPHLHSMAERIAIDGRPIGVDELCDRFAATVAFGRARGLRLTFFEVMTAVCADAFGARDLDLAIYEVGLGGRFDATTALPVDAAIVTGIELEHTEVLGDTIAAIAGEKACVIRAGGRAFTAARGEALAVIARHAEAVGARLAALGRQLRYEDERWDDDGFAARLRCDDGAVLPVRLPDARRFEPPALALAVAALRAVAPGVALSLSPAPRPALPGRFEVHVCPDGQPLVLDGAHTEESVATVAAELRRRWPGRPVAVLFASAAGKRWREAWAALLPVTGRALVTAVTGTATEDPAAIASWLQQRGCAAEVVPDAAAGLQRLLGQPGPRLVLGSFYLVGQVRGRIAAAGCAGPG